MRMVASTTHTPPYRRVNHGRSRRVVHETMDLPVDTTTDEIQTVCTAIPDNQRARATIHQPALHAGARADTRSSNISWTDKVYRTGLISREVETQSHRTTGGTRLARVGRYFKRASRRAVKEYFVAK